MDKEQKTGNQEFLLIGVDGGATKVNSCLVTIDSNDGFHLGRTNVSKLYRDYPQFDKKFTPVDLNQQLDEQSATDIKPTRAELKQGLAYSNACADSIIEICKQCEQNSVLVGIGMPGLKTPDQRGIAVMANGPRQPQYSNQLEAILKGAGIELVAPINHIGSDAFYCGMGEEYASDGQFRSVANAYYLGGGTGAADAMKLDDQLIQTDSVKNWFVKTWEMQCPEGRSVEYYVSSRGIQILYAELVKQSLAELDSSGLFPPRIKELALNGDEAAVETFEKVAKYLALLLYERLTTLYVGWQSLFDFVNPDRREPLKNHDFRHHLFDRIIIGQRLGDLLSESIDDKVFGKPFVHSLTLLLKESAVLDDAARLHYCPNGQLAENLIVFSKLREAPALGAAIDAYRGFMEKQ